MWRTPTLAARTRWWDSGRDYWPFMWVSISHWWISCTKDQWYRTLIVVLLTNWTGWQINSWVADDFKRFKAHVMSLWCNMYERDPNCRHETTWKQGPTILLMTNQSKCAYVTNDWNSNPNTGNQFSRFTEASGSYLSKISISYILSNCGGNLVDYIHPPDTPQNGSSLLVYLRLMNVLAKIPVYVCYSFTWNNFGQTDSVAKQHKSGLCGSTIFQWMQDSSLIKLIYAIQYMNHDNLYIYQVTSIVSK